MTGPLNRATAASGGGADSGSGTVWVLALCLVLWCCAAAVLVVTSVRADRHQAAAAADLAALAAAHRVDGGPQGVCSTARDTAEANGARLAECTRRGRTVTVETRMPTPVWPGEVRARSRAGPSRLE
ncbi:secretion/DNA translocation related TadE-like protein [Haloactinospora alba]|uniref:Secretion/DNA translocation related TadE-like protein n=1 Tax=Haloactinospora alba TaxID=405555 RepID=A0A543NA66_9ACTN|nr:Rv3654c family TadE-like protein [Haloactinospora alba]TQN28706.1 secretion/DNA translocation related TadE-like protein [Haloactinospora alba]